MITVNRAQLVAAIGTFSKVKNSMAMMSNFLVSSSSGIMTLRYTDNIVSTIIELPCIGDDTAEFPINRDAMLAHTKISKDTNIDITESFNVIAEFETTTFDTYRSMIVETVESNDIIEIPSSTIQGIVDILEPFVSDDTTRYFMNGIYFESAENSDELNIVATSGMVLGAYNNESLGCRTQKLSAIVPVQAFVFPKKTNGKVKLTFGTKHVMVELIQPGMLGTSYKRITQLIDGQFPNYRKVMPESFTDSITFNGNELHNAIKALKSFVNKSNRIFFRSIPGGRMELSVRDNAPKNVTLQVQGLCTRADIEFACSRELLAACIAGIDGNIVLKFTEVTRAMQIDGNGITRIIMPMMID